MNIDKIIAALEQVDELCCGELVDDSDMRCAIGQLLYADLGTARSISFQEQTTSMHKYDVSLKDRSEIVRRNNIINESPKARHIRMIEWFKSLKNDEPNDDPQPIIQEESIDELRMAAV